MHCTSRHITVFSYLYVGYLTTPPVTLTIGSNDRMTNGLEIICLEAVVAYF